ncbi:MULTISPECIES: WbqC family protein [unclassified Pseudomonas]|uniref:WbqC family protein n=1 Tax=unclassified Pseudomonas TaxID=196821 RepID=UPI0008713773|nr:MULTISPECIES: WbqC family protein [unclassified Pseudomonas]SCW95121.1 WbqC-like protein family protein [Pseudomonas sp. NFACC56-3]SFK77866.1 WbqC-like protein family protein [Pseudomonas sp. NFACC52]
MSQANTLKKCVPAADEQYRVALMQPYFLPYLGYFQLIAAVDCFVIYDNVQFIKNGWIERNRYLLEQEPKWFRVPLSKGSHTQQIMEKRIAETFDPGDILNKLSFAYRHAPHAPHMLAWLEALLVEPASSIAELNERILRACCALIGLQTPIMRSSDLSICADSKAQDRVLEVVQACAGTHYLNPVNGGHLYQAEVFQQVGITLELLKATLPDYRQGGREQPFVPGLSILDVLMYNDVQTVGAWAKGGEIVRA